MFVWLGIQMDQIVNSLEMAGIGSLWSVVVENHVKKHYVRPV
jgi:hypothetical protein